ncbi:MAG TPA: acylphosphatase [archaeon]|nr:acylphosphatase [archaeon]
MEKVVKLIVEGSVQGVGYRALVNQVAKRFRLKGYVKNLEDGSVEIVCFGDLKLIEEFKKSINIKSKKQGPLNMNVDNIIECPFNLNSELGFFHIDYDQEAKTPFERTNLERLEIGSLILSDMRDGTDQFREEAKSSFSIMGEKLDSVGDKIDNVGIKVDSLKEETNKNFNVLNSKTDQFREETNKNFNSLGEKYHSISENAAKIELRISELHEELVKSNNNNAVLIKSLVEKLDKTIR